MKVLQVNCVWRKGSTGKITADIHEELLRQGLESVVCYGRGETIAEPHVYKTCGEFYSKVCHALTYVTGLMYGSCGLSTRKLLSIIEQEQPDIVHLQCINGYFVNIYKLITWLKEHHIKTLLTLHAEFLYTANCGMALDCEKWRTGCGNCPRLRQETGSRFRDGTATSWRRMKQAFTGFEGDGMVVSVSPWLMERAQQAPILHAMPHAVVGNGVNTEVFRPYDGSALRLCHGLTGTPVVFHPTAYFSAEADHLKGGWALLALARRMPEVQFLVAGSHDRGITLPENVTLLGNLVDQQLLAQYYAMADAALLTSRRETFSMVVAESLCCGTPVIGFRAGGPERIALPAYGAFAEQGDLDGLETLVRKALAETPDRAGIAAKAAGTYSAGAMCGAYVQLYEALLKKG